MTSNMQLRPSAKTKAEYDLLVYGDIGESWFSEGVSAKDIAGQIAALPDAVKTLNIRINSFGGSVSEGFGVHNAIRAFPGKTVAIVEGVACSIASLIMMAADEVQVYPQSLVMVHAPWGGGSGNANEMRKTADVLDKFAEAMVSAYTRKGSVAEEVVRGLLTSGEDTWYTAQEAKDAGFADTILGETTVSGAAKALMDKAPFATRQLAMAAFRGVTPAQETKMPVEIEKPVAVEDKIEVVAAVTAADVQAKVVADAVAAARAEFEVEAKAKIEAAQAQVVEAQARLGAEIEAREVGAAVVEARSVFANLPGKAEDIGPAIRALRKADASAAATIEQVLKSVNALLADPVKSQTQPVGDARQIENLTPAQEIEALAKVKMAADSKLTLPQARVLVYTDRNDLVAALRSEKD